jgi:hypothetical protein
MPESLFVYSCFYPAGEGPFRAGYELEQPISGEISALSDHSFEGWTSRPRSSPTRPSLRVSPASLAIGFALARWKGIKWN